MFGGDCWSFCMLYRQVLGTDLVNKFKDVDMTDSFQAMCTDYFARLKSRNSIRTGADTAKARDKNIAAHKPARVLKLFRDSIKSEGPDIVSNFELDMTALKAYQNVPTPTSNVSKVEHHFLIYKEHGTYRVSKHFETPENGGAINYSCFLGERVDWTSVVAAAHTHPLYNDRRLNKLNEHFSQGDPSILIIKGVPLFLRTHNGDQIKVLEIRDGWITTRTIGNGSKATRWKAKG